MTTTNGRRVRIRDVAKHAGVSPATVSRVLNDSPLVREELYARVQRSIEELGYRPNQIASNLRRQRSRVIGVVVSDIESPYFASLVRGIEHAAYARGRRVLLCSTDETAQKQSDYLQVLAGERVAGVILSPSDPAGPEIGELLDFGIPVVAVDRSVADPRADAVLMEDAKGARQAVEHLLSIGHRQIGFVGGVPGIETEAHRLAGYQDAMRAAGLEPRFAEGSFRVEGGRAATRELLARDRSLTALIMANSLITIGALQVLREQSLRVPDDVGLVTIGDPPWTEFVQPPLTVLAPPVRQIAENAVAFIGERLSGERSEAKRLVLDFELRVRESCGIGRTPRR